MATTDATATTTTPRADRAAAGGDEAMSDAAPAGEPTYAGDASQLQSHSQPEAETETQPESQPQPQPDKAAPPPPPPAGPRASRLQDLFRSSLQHTLAKISWDNFAACYPTAAARNPVTLQAVHRAMVERLRELCASEFAVVLRNRDVVRRLNELEILAADARKRREEAAAGPAAAAAAPLTVPPPAPPARPPHTLPPETVLAAHLKPQRRAQRHVLEERLAAVQAANAAKFARLAVQQAEAEQLVAALERALGDAAGAAALLDGDDDGGVGEKNHVPLLTELARETRAAEAEMGNT